MDRRRSFAALALTLAGLTAAAPAASPPLREMRWIAADVPRADRVRLLTTRPTECLAPATDAAVAAQIAVGRAMFSAPLLLGGQAARAGLSCAACHVGRVMVSGKMKFLPKASQHHLAERDDDI